MHTSPSRYRPERPLRVLHLVLSFAPGGRRDAITTLAAASPGVGMEPHLASLRDHDPGLPATGEPFLSATSLEADGLPTWKMVRRLKRLCIESSIDIVHAHDASSQFAASMLRIVAPTQHSVMTFHRSLPIDVAGARNRLRNALSLPLISRVITASEERRSFFLKHNWISPDRVRTIPLGIDADRFAPDPGARNAIRAELGIGSDEFVALSVGHFNPEKGIDRAIEVMGAVAQRCPGVSFRHIILGRGDPERQAVLTAESGRLLPGRVHFAGFRPDPERWYNAADLLIHTPRLEAFGLVLPQAMACGTPVATVAVGGIPEIVDHGVSGIIVADGELDALIGEISELVGDRPRLSAISRAARESAIGRYGAGRYAGDHRTIYGEVLGRS